MEGVIDRFGKLFFILLLVPSMAYSISIDRPSSALDDAEINAILTVKPWDNSISKDSSCRNNLQKNKDDPLLNACAAAEAMANQQWNQAETYWQAAIQNYRNNNSIKAGFYLGLILTEIKQNKLTRARASAKKALEITPDSISVRFWLARVYERDLNKKAILEYEKIVSIVPPATAWLEQYYHAVAIVKTQQQSRYPYAKTEIQNFLRQNPDYYAAITLLAYVDLALGNTASAIRQLKRAENLIPTQPFALRLLTQAYFVAGNIDQAIQSGKQLLRLKPKDLTGNYLLGAAYLKIGKQRLGNRYMSRVSSLNPDIKEAKLQLISSYFSMGQVKKANGLIDELLGSQVSNFPVEAALIKLLATLGRYDEATQRVNRILDAYPTDKRFRYLKAVVLSSAGKAAGAEKILTRLIKENPQFKSAHLTLARVYIMQKQFSRAESLLTEYLAQWPTSASAHMLQGDLAVFTNKPSLARKAYTLAVKADGNARSAWDKLLQYEIKTGKLENAGKLAKQLVSTHPDFPDGYFFQAVIAYIEKNNDLAKGLFEKALSIDPRYYKALNHLALISITQPTKAIGYFTKSLAINPRQAVVYGQLANAYLMKADQTRFLKTIKRWSKYFPDLSQPYELQAKAARQSGDFKQAVTLYKKAIAIAPKRSINYLMLGDTYKKMKAYKPLIETYRAALNVFPDSPVFLNNLAGGYIAVQQYQKAMRVAKSAEKQAPDNWQIKDTIGQIHFLEGELELALKKYHQAIQLNQNPTIAYHLGKAYLQKGDKEKAKSYFDMADSKPSLLSVEARADVKKYLSSF